MKHTLREWFARWPHLSKALRDGPMSDSRLIDQPLTHISSSSDALRRMLDIVVSFIALLILSPFMLLIAVAIMLDGGRPIFFKQVRLGKNGKPFNMYKFRKFHRDCGTAG